MPNAVAMTSEFSPHRRRATMVMIMFCGFSVGAALGGLLAAGLIPQFGWRSVFVVGGIAPLALAPILAWRLPESVRFLALAGRAPTNGSPNCSATSIRRLCSHPRRSSSCMSRGWPACRCCICSGKDVRCRTLLLWVVFFMSLLDLYFLSNWLPTVLNDLGASVSTAALIGSMLQVGGVVGTFALGSVIDRFSFRALALVYFCAVFAVGAIGQLGHSVVFVTLGDLRRRVLHRRRPDRRQCARGDVLSDLGQGYRRRLGARHRPGRLDRRALVGGALLAAKWSTGSVFIAAAMAALCAALAAFSLSRLAGMGGGKGLEQPSSFDATLQPAART